jgi:hypothetical protein
MDRCGVQELDGRAIDQCWMLNFVLELEAVTIRMERQADVFALALRDGEKEKHVLARIR